MMLDKEQIKSWDGEPEGEKKPEADKPDAKESPARKPAPKPAAVEARTTEMVAPLPDPPIVPPAQPTQPAVEPLIPLTAEQVKARKRRSHWTAIALFTFVILIFVITLTKLGANVLVRDL